MMDMRSPLSRARGLGSATEGGGTHWWVQRLTSIALVPLVLWFIYSAVSLVGADHAQYAAWLGGFGNSLLMVLLTFVLFHHAQLGMQVVIEDYVHGEGPKLAGIIAVKFIAVLCGVSCIVAILRVSFGA